MADIKQETVMRLVKCDGLTKLSVRGSLSSADEAVDFINLLIANVEAVFDVDINLDAGEQPSKPRQVA